MPNLALTRRPSESIFIGSDVKITIVSCSSGKVRLAIEAPREIAIERSELRDREEPRKEGAR